MNQKEFDELLNVRMAKARHVLSVKSAEYVRGDDKLHNFKRAARADDVTPERALHGMLLKHYISYLDMLDDLEQGKLPSVETVEEKFGDIINYFILQEALIKERIQKTVL